MAGTALNKWIIISGVTATSFRWDVVNVTPTIGTYFSTCDDCIDYLIYGTDATNFATEYLAIPAIGSGGVVNHTFAGNVRVGLAQTFDVATASSVWTSSWSTLPIIYTATVTGQPISNGTVICYTPEKITGTVIGWNTIDLLIQRADGNPNFYANVSSIIVGACSVVCNIPACNLIVT